MRIIVNKKRSEKYSRENLLRECKMKSVNHILSEAILSELFNAFHNNIEDITSEFVTNQSNRHGPTLRTLKDQNIFVSIAASLWNRSTERLRSFNITPSEAKSDIRNIVKSKIPVV